MKHQSPNPVHPRLRGELFACHKLSFALFGSSPLTRGTPRPMPVYSVPGRFIPAYAGNSSRISGILPESPVHPRLRGELLGYVQNLTFLFGSSPLTRGTLKAVGVIRENLRFIPAYAGNSSCLRRVYVTHTVHPRLRGELRRY